MELEYEEWMRKHTSLLELLDKLNENEKTIKSEISSICSSLSEASTVESSKLPSSSLSLKEINNDVNEYNSSSVQLTKWVKEVINDSYENIKSVWTSDMKMDMYAPNAKKFYQKYSFEKHHNISKEMMYFYITKYSVHEGFSGSSFSDLCRDVCKQPIKNGFYLVKNGKVMRNGEKNQLLSVIIILHTDPLEKSRINHI